jgi:hypothetical protein
MRTRLVQAAYEAAVAEGRFAAPQEKRARTAARAYRDSKLSLLAPHFDFAYYAYENPEAAAAGLDELEHYYFLGWRKLANPTAWFDTAAYLTANPDVLASGENPFWHYIFKGRAEGRAPRRPRGLERRILESLLPPEARGGDSRAPDLPRLSAEALAERLTARLVGASGLVFSVSHDDYLTINGGAQLCIAEEEAAFRAQGWAYLHACPLRGVGVLKQLPAAWTETRLALDGEEAGVASDAEIARALQLIAPAPARALIVHCLLGHSVDGLLTIEAALQPDERHYWLHDFSSLCTSYNLLRNDVAFCGAPPPESPACGICIHGETRRAHLAELARLFERCRFTVLAPSARALELWLGSTSLPYAEARVVAHAGLEPIDEPLDLAEDGEIGQETRPVRVAFVGLPSIAKGWLTYERILETCGDLVAYALHHFANKQDLRPRKGLVSIETTVRSDNRDLMRDRLIERRIDLVVAPAEWPETFSFVAFEALAAGADILTLGCSGNVAALVEAERRGRVFASADELVAFFVSGKAIAYARERDRFPRYLARLRREGGSPAALGLPHP